MQAVPLLPYARLPRAHARLECLSSTVDAVGRTHWLLVEASHAPGDGPHRVGPYDAVVVTVDDGRAYETELSAVTSRHPLLDVLPDGGFVVADARRGVGDHVQVFDALGRASWTFAVGDGIEHLLADESGDLWVGYFDEGVVGDELSRPGVRRWSAAGGPLWAYDGVPGAGRMVDCYALNVDRRAVWAYPHTDFPLLEIRDGRPVTARTTPVRGARGIAVHGGRVAFLGGYGQERDRLVLCELAETAAEPVSYGALVRHDGERVVPRRVVSRGSRVYVQDASSPSWGVYDLS
ncbi:hypothetical protein AB0M39_39515 [Streptomyces sp. NPDC051907]|uniref:hypothetical protein n=1 Tax=Streptomyces sp. NPDC051907 TaxID=3155284 RepID=UPI00343726F7